MQIAVRSVSASRRVHSGLGVEIVTVEMQGNRPYREDRNRVLCNKNQCLTALFDGLGDSAACSEFMRQSLLPVLAQEADFTKWPQKMLEVDARFLSMGGHERSTKQYQNADVVDSGVTCMVARVRHTPCILPSPCVAVELAHVGDVRAVMFASVASAVSATDGPSEPAAKDSKQVEESQVIKESKKPAEPANAKKGCKDDPESKVTTETKKETKEAEQTDESTVSAVHKKKTMQWPWLTQDHCLRDATEVARVEHAGGDVRGPRGWFMGEYQKGRDDYQPTIDGTMAWSRAFGLLPYKLNSRLAANEQKVVAVPTLSQNPHLLKKGQIMLLHTHGLCTYADGFTLKHTSDDIVAIVQAHLVEHKDDLLRAAEATLQTIAADRNSSMILVRILPTCDRIPDKVVPPPRVRKRRARADSDQDVEPASDATEIKIEVKTDEDEEDEEDDEDEDDEDEDDEDEDEQENDADDAFETEMAHKLFPGPFDVAHDSAYCKNEFDTAVVSLISGISHHQRTFNRFHDGNSCACDLSSWVDKNATAKEVKENKDPRESKTVGLGDVPARPIGFCLAGKCREYLSVTSFVRATVVATLNKMKVDLRTKFPTWPFPENRPAHGGHDWDWQRAHCLEEAIACATQALDAGVPIYFFKDPYNMKRSGRFGMVENVALWSTDWVLDDVLRVSACRPGLRFVSKWTNLFERARGRLLVVHEIVPGVSIPGSRKSGATSSSRMIAEDPDKVSVWIRQKRVARSDGGDETEEDDEQERKGQVLVGKRETRKRKDAPAAEDQDKTAGKEPPRKKVKVASKCADDSD